MTRMEEEKIKSLERKVRRTIIRSKNEENECTPLMNFEMEVIMEGEDGVKFIKAKWIK